LFFPNMMLNTLTFANNFDFIWAFSYCYLSNPKVVTKHLTGWVC